MKKKIEKTFCDDCGKEIPWNEPVTTINIIVHTSEFSGTIGTLKDFCWECLEWRVNNSCDNYGPRMNNQKRCEKCNGSGKIYVFKADPILGQLDGIKDCPNCKKGQ